MGRFERKIRKKINSEIEDFDVWYEKNKSKFADKKESFSYSDSGEVRVKVKNKLNFVIIIVPCLLCICFLLAILVPALKGGFSIGGDFHFNADDVINSVMDEDTLLREEEKYPYLNKIEQLKGLNLIVPEDNVIVMSAFEGELQNDDNLYLVTVQIVYHENYDLLNTMLYSDLSESVTQNGYLIEYEFFRMDFSQLYWYRLRSENNGMVAYWDVHCLDDDIGWFISTVFN